MIEHQLSNNNEMCYSTRPQTFSRTKRSLNLIALKPNKAFCILNLMQKYDFQPSTTKSDNRGHPTVEIGQI